ncbi:MAG TPA: hypothetical protein VI997_07165 [Candidatus Thermoplasmatota archaeon]|nr:hypothetical protein [Candidatus Thermoplasmatota archaeon]
MGRTLRFLAKWTLLTALAAIVGTSLGAAYATNLKPIDTAEESRSADENGDGIVSPRERDTVAPPQPVLTTPADGAYVSWRPLLAWEPVADPSTVIYAIAVSPDPGFPPETTTIVRNLDAPEWRPEQPLSPLVKQYWRVYALDAGLNEGPWSEARSFTPLLPVDGLEVVVDLEDAEIGIVVVLSG